MGDNHRWYFLFNFINNRWKIGIRCAGLPCRVVGRRVKIECCQLLPGGDYTLSHRGSGFAPEIQAPELKRCHAQAEDLFYFLFNDINSPLTPFRQ